MIDLQELLGKIRPYVLGWAHPAWQVWIPTPTGYSSGPTNTFYRYRKNGTSCTLIIRQGGVGISNADPTTLTLPFTAATITNAAWSTIGPATDNGGAVAAVGFIVSGGTVITFYKDVSFVAFTTSGNKRIVEMTITYETE